MTINKSLTGGKLTPSLDGRLDILTAPDFEHLVKNELEDVTELVIDMEKLEYISSAGLRVLLTARKLMQNKGGMKIVGANQLVKEVFEVTGFASILNIE